jgi:hypothetical protein
LKARKAKPVCPELIFTAGKNISFSISNDGDGKDVEVIDTQGKNIFNGRDLLRRMGFRINVILASNQM